MRPALSALLALALLSGCTKRPAGDLPTKVMFTAAGSYDASADVRSRLGRGMRRVTWQKQPPLPAAQVNVDYDSDARPVTWIMTITRPSFSAETLLGQGAQKVTTPDGPGLLGTSGPLNNILVLQRGEVWQLLTRGYAAQKRPTLLPAFKS